MARLNNRPSTRSEAAAIATYISDEENRDPQDTRRQQRKNRRTMDSQSDSLTPTISEDRGGSRRAKRKHIQLTQPSGLTDEEDEVDMRDEAKFNKYFDPHQDPEQRRQVKRKSRALEREFNENRDKLLHDDGDELAKTINQANNVFKSVKQTNDATLDSRLFVNLSNLAAKRSAQLALGDNNTGVDVEEFLNKCVTFLKNGSPNYTDGFASMDTDRSTLTQRRPPQRPTQSQGRRRDQHDRDEPDSDEGDDSIPFDWALMGATACFPYNARSACPAFLLGPLSVEKKIRKQTQRQSKQLRDTTTKETRPAALTKDDLSQSDENGLTAACARLKKHLMQHIATQQRAMEQHFSSEEELTTEAGQAWLKEHRITAEGGPFLFDYVIDPLSFGQTVENMFHVSFLIKEGHAGISAGPQGMPIISYAEPSTVDEKRANNASRRQAVFALDFGTWKKLIKAFDIVKPMIPPSEVEEASQIGQRGWYA